MEHGRIEVKGFEFSLGFSGPGLRRRRREAPRALAYPLEAAPCQQENQGGVGEHPTKTHSGLQASNWKTPKALGA